MTQPTNHQEQRETRDQLVRAATFATDMFLMDHPAELAQVTAASRTRLTLQVAIGYLISRGLITATPEDQWPEWLEMHLPEHMQPDLAEAIAQLARMNRSMR